APGQRRAGGIAPGEARSGFRGPRFASLSFAAPTEVASGAEVRSSPPARREFLLGPPRATGYGSRRCSAARARRMGIATASSDGRVHRSLLGGGPVRGWDPRPGPVGGEDSGSWAATNAATVALPSRLGRKGISRRPPEFLREGHDAPDAG